MNKSKYEELMNAEIGGSVWLSQRICVSRYTNAIELTRYVDKYRKKGVRTTVIIDNDDYRTIKKALAECREKCSEFIRFNDGFWLHGIIHNA